MYLKSLELIGFKSFGKKSELEFSTPITGVVGPNGSGKSNCAEAFRFALGEQSFKSMRGKRGEDLIWGGSQAVPRSNRASVKVVFDNTQRLLNVDFDEVTLERVVYRDGTNEYYMNGTKVRLKDVTELLAGANIGSSGHHIISQGEADRVLAATPKERKQMIEDALGLRIYQYKKDESLKKLEKTEENRKQVASLRKENEPHLRFLERQVKKLERARVLREELITKYQEYLKREEQYLGSERTYVEDALKEPQHRQKELTERIAAVRHMLEKIKSEDEDSQALLEFERRLGELRRELGEYTRTLGRIEGQIAFEKRRLENERKKAEREEGRPVPYKHAKALWEELTQIFSRADHENGTDARTLSMLVRDAQKVLRHFVEDHRAHEQTYDDDRTELLRLEDEQRRAEAQQARIKKEVDGVEAQIRALQGHIDSTRDKNRDLEHELFTRMNEETQVRATLAQLDQRQRALEEAEAEFKREVREGVALIGRHVLGYREYQIADDATLSPEEPRTAQLERRRDLEKMKIRLEEMGGGNADEIVKEYEETKERDEFLGRELADLENSASSLRDLIVQLEEELSAKFSQGVATISAQFNEFFALMFGGGSAQLTVINKKKTKGMLESMLESLNTDTESRDEKEVPQEEGVDVSVSLPKKRIQNLMMLSGGERALTSIALIFAMSQVNPPPFIILDETDAALDEANSKRYGDLIELLAQKSQLILITHNRETMSRAGVLYGITMGIDGVSRLLSVKLDEAVAVAK